MSLPRDLHVWLQSLDLSSPVKHPKRDFSNGYLVAEIVSRYLPGALSLRQFSNASSIEGRLANWEQLERVVQKQGWPLTRREMDELMHGQPNSHIRFLSHLYSILTSRTAGHFTAPAATAAASAPSFLAPTASTLVKARLHDADIVGGLLPPLDANRQSAAVSASIAAHSDDSRVERKKQARQLRQHMARHRMTNRPPAANGSAAADSAAEPQCTLKAVTIRQTATPSMSAIASSLLGGAAAGHQARPAVQRSSIAALNAVVINSPLLVDYHCEAPFTTLIAGLVSPSNDSPFPPLSDELLSELIDSIAADALDSLAHNALQSPKDFYTSLSLLFPLLSLPPLTSLAFQSALTLLSQWGTRLSSADSVLAEGVALDYVLPKLVTLMSVQRQKTHLVLPLLWSFIRDEDDTRGRLMATLPLHCAEPTLLLMALSALLTSSMSSATVAAVMPVAAAHFGSDSPVLRALALSLLAPIAASDWHAEAETWWPVVKSIGALDEWCVRAEAVHVCCCLLANTLSAEAVDDVYAVINRLLAPTVAADSATAADWQSFALSVSAAPHISTLLGGHPPLRALFFRLLSSSAAVKQYSLASILPFSLPSSIATLLLLFTPDLRSSYSPLLLAQSLLDVLRASRQSSLSACELQLLACAVHDGVDDDERWLEAAEGWADVVRELREHVLAAISVEGQSRYALAILAVALANEQTRGHTLRLFVASPAAPSAFSQVASPLLQSATDDRDALVEWLWQWSDGQDGVMAEVVRKTVRSWQASGVSGWKECGLAELLDTIEGSGKQQQQQGAGDEVNSVEEKQQLSADATGDGT